MKYKTKPNIIKFLLLACCVTISSVSANHHEAGETQEVTTAERSMILSIEAKITHIDIETRQVSLTGPGGETQTLTVGADVARFGELAIGDTVTATYLTSLVAELREPTEAEKMNPFVEVTDQVQAASSDAPGGAVARIIRAVCSIEGMNRITRTVTILDAHGRIHVIFDVELENFPTLTLGQLVIMTFTEAVALSLEKTS